MLHLLCAAFLAASCFTQPALAADPPAFLTKAASEHVAKTFKKMTDPGGKPWADAMKNQALPAVHLSKKRFVPAERTQVPEGMRLGHLKDWKNSQANYLSAAQAHFEASAAEEKENTQSGINRGAFTGNSVNLSKLSKTLSDKLKGIAGAWQKAAKRASIARGVSPKVGTKDAMNKKEVSGFARPWATSRKLQGASQPRKAGL